ncbi:hypothetical protein B9Z65_1627 [Elsinoe australis]|uniref:2,6-dihydroxypyridine 3-monooxygenase substrate binding domain-containing protein n=1 Tax=Elsinoe australis TaxID=40998 RepID=A0A2P7YGG6_9PEZI|nr:hypothetical protein B9Z65_1627 [Elsinoe australis]
MASPQPNRVLLLGGSLSSLMHSLVLSTHSPCTSLTILERSPTALLHNQGAGVVAGPDVQSFFDTYVRPGRSIAVASKARLYLDKKGDIIPGSVEEREQRMTSWDVLYRLLRWRVDGMEAGGYWGVVDAGTGGAQPGNEGVGKVEYRYGCQVVGVEDLGREGVRVRWVEGEGQGEEKNEVVDLVVAADGASSAVRGLLRPDVKRKYVGYVALRGTVKETDMSEAASEVFFEKFAFFHTQGIQILAYLIPGENGDLRRGKRLMNWVWYVNFEDGGKELEELMTDAKGKRYPITLPAGGMRDEIWEREKKRAQDVLPPQFAELVTKTKQPFVQAITDVICDENMFFDDKVVLVGDSLAGFRPHTAASTSQAAFDATTLGEWMQGKIDRDTYRTKVLNYAKDVQEHGVKLGERSQFEALMGFRSSISTSVPTDSPPAESTSSKVPDVDPSRSPIPLSSSQEAQVREIYHKNVRNKCANEVRDFAACATNRTFTAPFVCRAQRRAMNTCMIAFATQDEQDAARKEWFETRDLRRRERELKEEKRKEQEKFHKEWWGLDDNGRRILNKDQKKGEDEKK